MSTNLDCILRLKAVLDQTGLCRSTLYRKMANGTFPKNIQLSARCVGWRASAVEEWLRNPMFYHVDDRSRMMAPLATSITGLKLACGTCP